MKKTFAHNGFWRTFATLQDDDCIRYAGQAVKLLISYMGIFYVQSFAGDINVGSKIHIRYWRLPIRKIHICSRSEYNHLVAAYMAAAFLLPFINHFKCYKMENLVYNGENGQAMTNSLLVAEKFGKDRKHVYSPPFDNRLMECPKIWIS